MTVPLDATPLPSRPSTRDKINGVIRATIEPFDVDFDTVIGPARDSYTCIARNAAVAAVRAAFPERASLVWLARVFRRDRSTICHSLRRHRERTEAQRADKASP